MKNQYNLPCNIAQTLNIIGDKWSLLIVHEITIGNCTFKDIEKNLVGISTNVLASRLKSLEQDNIIKSELYQRHPPRFKYKLTESGEDFKYIFNSIILWGEKHLDKCYKRLTHNECGHSVTEKYFCNHCNKIIETDDIIVAPIEK